MAKKRKYFHEEHKLLDFPTSKSKRLFLKAKSINGSKEDARFALTNALNAFIQDVVQGTISVAIENARSDKSQEVVSSSSSYESSEIDEEEDEEDQSSHFKLKLNVGHLKKYLDSNQNKFDFLDDTFEKYNNETLFNNDNNDNNNKEKSNEKKPRNVLDTNEDLYIAEDESSYNKHKKKKSPASIEARVAISSSTSSAKSMALNIRHKENFGNLDEVIFDGEEMDFN